MSELALPSSLRAWLLGGLLVSFYPLLGLKRAFSLIGIGLALYGIFLLFRRGRVLFENPAIRAGLMVAAGFALPLLFALTDAAFPEVSAAATASSLLYLPILIAVIVLVQEQQVTRPMLLLSVMVTAFWVLDGVVQLACGYDIFGMAYNSHRIGAYWQNQMKFGYYMGFFGLFAVAAQAVCWPHRRFILIGFWLIIALGVLISGNREAWLMFFPASAVLFWVHVARFSQYRWLVLVSGLILACLLVVGAYELSFTVRDRIAQSLNGLHWSYAALDEASSHRLDLWRVAVELIAEHPINGLGMDAYQVLLPELARDPLWHGKADAPYPHQYLFEIGAASGVIGWFGLIMIFFVVKRAWFQASNEQRAMAWPALIYLMALWFPLNTHRSFYSSELIMGNLLMMGIILGNLLPVRKSTQVAGKY